MDKAIESWYFSTNDESACHSKVGGAEAPRPPSRVRPKEVRAAPADRRCLGPRFVGLHPRRAALPWILRRHSGDAWQGVVLARLAPPRRAPGSGVLHDARPGPTVGREAARWRVPVL